MIRKRKKKDRMEKTYRFSSLHLWFHLGQVSGQPKSLLEDSRNENREGDGTHSSTLAWKIPWTEEPDRLQSMGSLRVGHN